MGLRTLTAQTGKQTPTSYRDNRHWPRWWGIRHRPRRQDYRHRPSERDNRHQPRTRDNSHHPCRWDNRHQPHTRAKGTDPHQDYRHRPDTGMTGTDLTPGLQELTLYHDEKTQAKNMMPTPYQGRHWPEGILRQGINNAGKIVTTANEDTTSCRGKMQGIGRNRQLVRKRREKTVRGGEAGLRNGTKQRAHLKKSANWPDPPSTTHKPTIDLSSPITANTPPNPPFHLQTATNSTKMATEHSRSTSTTGPSGRSVSTSAGPSSQAGSSTSAGLSTNTLPNHAHDQRQFIELLALAIPKKQKQMPHLGTMGTPVFGGADVTKFIEPYESLSPRNETDPAA